MIPPFIFEASALLLRSGFDSDVVVRALRLVGEGLAVDRVYIFEDVLVDGIRCASQRYEWTSMSAQPQIDNPVLQEMPYDVIAPEWPAIFAAGGLVKGLVREMPTATRELLEAPAIRSILVCPIPIEWVLRIQR